MFVGYGGTSSLRQQLQPCCASSGARLPEPTYPVLSVAVFEVKVGGVI